MSTYSNTQCASPVGVELGVNSHVTVMAGLANRKLGNVYVPLAGKETSAKMVSELVIDEYMYAEIKPVYK